MEFFALASSQTDPETLQRGLGVAHLARWCVSIDSALEHAGDRGRICSVWR
ncbi:MAG: hypothetical protein LC667_07815 [Thioalkalivibrio sp.]|nr:hypothetical protein [Thioalkalivibrio sp.]